MAASSPDARVDEDLLTEVLHAYLQAVDAGRAPDREDLCRAHPELATALQAFFAGQNQVECLARAIRPETPAGDLLNDTTAGVARPAGESPDLEPGEVFGDYELLEEIARGGMGVVWKARQRSVKRVVALKMILAGELALKADVLRFQREAEAVGQLDHPNLVPIYEVGEHAGQHFFTMKLIEGGSLAAALAGGSRPNAARLMATVARALHHAHQRGVLHRDLKPANILLDAAGEPHVVDFGLAKRVEGDRHLTQSGAIVGTPSYMAPEQASGETRGLTTAADTYALGAILYEMLAGRPPFVGDHPLDVIIACRVEEPAPPSKFQPKLSRDLETICLKCLEKDPAKRYATAAALADDLDRFLGGEPILARPARWWERGVKWARRRPAIAAMSLLVVVVAALGVGGVVWKWREAEAALVKLANTLYFKQISLAERYLASGQADRASTILDECPVDLRHWEWHYLKRQSSPDVLRLRGHTNMVVGVAFSPDGKYLASASQDGTVRLWDAANGQEIGILARHEGGATCVSFSGDSRQLATAGADQTVQIVDVVTGKEIRAAIPGAGDQVAFSPDGKLLACGGRDRTVSVWDAGTGVRLHELDAFEGIVLGVAFSPNGRLVGAVGYRSMDIRVWDAITGKEYLHEKLKNRPRSAYCFAFSPNGRHLAIPLSDSFALVDPITGKSNGPTIPAVMPGLPKSVAFSADGQRLGVTYSFRHVVIYDVTTGKALYQLAPNQSAVPLITFHPDRRRQAIARGRLISIEEFGGKTGRAPRLLGIRQERGEHSFALSPDGRTLAGCEGKNTNLVIRDLQSGKITRNLPIPTDATALCFSPDGRQLAVAFWAAREVRLWELATGTQTAILLGHSGKFTCIGFSPDGRHLAACGNSHQVTVWDATTGEHLRDWESGRGCMRFDFGKDGRHLAINCVDVVQIWDTRAGKVIRTLVGHKGDVLHSRFSPDCRYLASVGGEITVRVWDVAAGRELYTLPGHSTRVFALNFSPDGRRLVTGGEDGTLKVWDVATGQEVLTLAGHETGITFVGFTPDGATLITGGKDGVVKVWDGTPFEEDDDPN